MVAPVAHVGDGWLGEILGGVKIWWRVGERDELVKEGSPPTRPGSACRTAARPQTSPTPRPAAPSRPSDTLTICTTTKKTMKRHRVELLQILWWGEQWISRQWLARALLKLKHH